MKKTITFLTILVLTALTALEAQASKLYLTTNTFRSTAFIGGQQYFSRGGEFNIEFIQPGNHLLTVREARNRGNRGHRHHRDYRYRGNEFNHPRHNTMFFRGRIHIPRNSVVFARITPRGRLVVDRIQPMRRQRPRQPQRRDYRDYRNYRDYDYQRDYRDNRGPRYNRQSNFNVAQNMIRQASFESERLSIARQYVRNNPITSRQVLVLMNEMDFESSKLDIAKMAYHNTTDPENYFIVNQGFGFSSSINALNRYIR